ncbi:MAG: DNA-3-methyladenine glycosylase I [Acidobacteria bacterium]|nr:DNA-3-methyladenine glycosylase I [Acidobacteriota bacterium]
MTAAPPRRCAWAGDDSVTVAYHDREWGVPVHGDVALFELLTLEGAQAGLSWSTILKKRDNYRRAFAGFDPEKVGRFNSRSVARLLHDSGIVRNRLKVESTISNARAFLSVQKEFGSFDTYIWGFVDGAPWVNEFRTLADIPASTEVSNRMSKDLNKRGFRFVGSTICYALMQAAGLVNDHEVDCFRYAEISGRRSRRR